MQTIDLGHIMKVANVETSFIASHLFPEHNHGNRAVTRIIKGEGFLNSWQIAKLSEVLNVPIGLLFEDVEWSMSAPAGQKGILYFRIYDYFAELNTADMTTRISKDNMLFFEKMSHPEGIMLTEYLADLTDLIIKYRQK